MNRQKSSFSRVDFESSSVNEKGVKGCLKKVSEKMKTFGKKNTKILEIWRKFVLSACVAALAIDPLFFFIPEIDSKKTCIGFDKKLGITVCVFRIINDTFYGFNFIFFFITQVIVPRFQKPLRGELDVHSNAVRKKQILLYLIVDIVSVLPIPQVLSLMLRPSASVLVSKTRLIRFSTWMIVGQYIPRIIRIYPLYKQVTKTSSTITESNWIGAALNLILFLLFSYVFGAFWYVTGVGKKTRCWREKCDNTPGCDLTTDMFCVEKINNSRFLSTSCPLIDPDKITDNSSVYNFGMYIDLLKSGVAERNPRDFPRKFVYCFWWGLRSLSTFGQSLNPGNSATDMFFAILICVSGLFLFAVLIGNVQKYMISTTVRLEEMKERKRDREKWMSSRKLPKYLKKRIRKNDNYKWRQFRGMEEDTLLRCLPKYLRLQTKRHLYMNLLKSVPLLEKMNEWQLEALCDRAKSVFYLANSSIVREGDPVEEMLIVTKGKLNCITKSSETPDHYVTSLLNEGDVCGDLHFWIFDPSSSPDHPPSPKTVTADNDVEGFILLPDDLKFVASHLNRETKVAFEEFFRSRSGKRRSEGSSSKEPHKSANTEISEDEIILVQPDGI